MLSVVPGEGAWWCQSHCSGCPLPSKQMLNAIFAFCLYCIIILKILFGFLSVSENESYSRSFVKAKCCKVNFPKARLLVQFIHHFTDEDAAHRGFGQLLRSLDEEVMGLGINLGNLGSSFLTCLKPTVSGHCNQQCLLVFIPPALFCTLRFCFINTIIACPIHDIQMMCIHQN